MTAIEPILPAPGRSCGTCRLCCKVLAIAELGKPPFAWCEHACARGCAIYDARPEECRSYVCSWLAGSFRDEDRPDRARLVVHVAAPPRWAQDGSTGSKHEVAEAFVSNPGAERQGRGREILDQILARGWAVAVHKGFLDVTLYFPSGHVTEVPRDLVDGDFGSWRDAS